MNAKRTYAALASAIQARQNCIASHNTEWEDRWGNLIASIMDDAPNGSGFDSGTELIDLSTTATKLVFTTAFHHMDENGMYDGWTEHTVTVTPAFDGIDIRVSGRNRNDIKEYIAECFDAWLNTECIMQA